MKDVRFELDYQVQVGKGCERQVGHKTSKLKFQSRPMPFAFCSACSLFARLALSVRTSVFITQVIQYAEMSFLVSVFCTHLAPVDTQ